MQLYGHKLLKNSKYRKKNINCYLCNKNIIIFVVRKTLDFFIVKV